MNAPPLRIAHVVLDLHEGGLERLVVDLALGMRSRGHLSRVFCLRRRGQLADELDASEVAVVPPLGGLQGMLRPIPLVEALREFRPNVVHGHSGAFFKTTRASAIAGLPVVLTDHGRPYPDPFSARAIDGLAARGADSVVAVSNPLRDYLARRLAIPRAKLKVIPNGVRPFIEPPVTVANAAAQALGQPERLLIGSVGRLDRVKAYDVLIRALKIVRDRWTGSRQPHLVLVGDGPDRPRLEALISELGLGANVTLAGWTTDVRPVLCALDVFALSSDSEGTSVSLLEAMQARRAIVATAVGGNPEVLGRELAGQLVPPQDPAALAEALARLLESPQLRQVIGDSAQSRVNAAYSQPAMLDSYEALYGALARTN